MVVKPKDFLIDSYRRAGADYLAYRLADMFTEIKNEADVVRHNATLKEVNVMIGDKPMTFMKSLFYIVVPEPKEKFLRRVASYILTFVTKG
jgi:hypothetical protein